MQWSQYIEPLLLFLLSMLSSVACLVILIVRKNLSFQMKGNYNSIIYYIAVYHKKFPKSFPAWIYILIRIDTNETFAIAMIIATSN